MSAAAIVYQNLADDGIITASSSIAQTPPSVLQDPHVARHWRSTTAVNEFLVCDLGSLQSIDVVALFGLSLTEAALTRVRISTADPTGAAGNAYDSTVLAGEVSEDYACLIDMLPAPVTGRYVRIDMSETGPTYIEAGRLVIGLSNQFEVNFMATWSRAFVDRSRKTESRGGQTFIDHDVSYRMLELTFEHIVEDQRHGFVEQIDLINGHSTDVLFVTDPASVDLGRDSIWGLIDDMTPVLQQYVSLPPVYAKQYNIRERL